jgi:hypothetical protein
LDRLADAECAADFSASISEAVVISAINRADEVALLVEDNERFGCYHVNGQQNVGHTALLTTEWGKAPPFKGAGSVSVVAKERLATATQAWARHSGMTDRDGFSCQAQRGFSASREGVGTANSWFFRSCDG